MCNGVSEWCLAGIGKASDLAKWAIKGAHNQCLQFYIVHRPCRPYVESLAVTWIMPVTLPSPGYTDPVSAGSDNPACPGMSGFDPRLEARPAVAIPGSKRPAASVGDQWSRLPASLADRAMNKLAIPALIAGPLRPPASSQHRPPTAATATGPQIRQSGVNIQRPAIKTVVSYWLLIKFDLNWHHHVP